MTNGRLTYALVTPARNEEAYIEKTLKSVISQTVQPRKWVVVDDGSTDRTAEIVRRYTKGLPWIELLQMPEHKEFTFSSKALCFNAGFERLRNTDFDVIGNVDADVAFEPDYFEFLLSQFEAFPDLGVAGTPLREGDYDAVNDAIFNETDVFGACQLFRRECFEQVGGYTPVKGGGIDWIALRTARMRGWKTRSFLEKRFLHLRPMGHASGGSLKARFRHGEKDYFLGNHPLWQLLRVIYQGTRRPYLVGGLSLLAGYVWAAGRGLPRPVSKDLIRFHRREQMQRLREIGHAFLRKPRLERGARG